MTTEKREPESPARRGFLRGSGLVAVSAAVGASIPFAHLLPNGLLPVVLAQTSDPLLLPGKSGLTILNDRPINAETPAHLLDDPITPASRLFVRNNGVPPVTGDIDPMDWVLSIEGEACEIPQTFT